MSSMSLSEELAWRGFVNQTTFKDITAIDNQSLSFYFGVDPSADSMTIGNLAAAMMVRLFMQHGHKATLLIGGATGLIGDPDGKKQERDLKSIEEVQANTASIVAQYDIVFSGMNFDVVNNYDWFKDISYLDFLYTVGKHVPMSAMVGREFVQSRIAEGGAGISYAEFSYSLIQGYDFLHLYREKGVTLQVSGADQWGNSIAGVDLIRRIEGAEAHVWTVPLVVNKTTGVKFGKSEDGAIWLDSSKTSPYKFYQFWLNCDDAGSIDYLKVYTTLTREQIEAIEAEFLANPSDRLAQKTLAYEVTKLIHGEAIANDQKRIADILFGTKNYADLDAELLQLLESELPFTEARQGDSYVDVLVATGLATSKRQAREFIINGAVWNADIAQIEQTDQTLDTTKSYSNYVIL
ncbi:tyrosine--tRNA ligase, partial [Candidatus Saccharibacteria bacterium]|nr:tyrosine--tRNA ligase [Candidatus Saccharibacteria bacterium]